MNAVILVVDDEKAIRIGLKQALREQGYDVVLAESAEEALAKVEESLPDLVMSDIRLPQMNGIEFLREAKQHDPNLTFIVMTGFGNVDTAVEATRLGAYDYVQKPFKMDRLLLLVERALESQALRREVLMLRAMDHVAAENGYLLVGKSKPMREVYHIIKQVANSPASTVLVQGESGTGKELVAQSIHYASARRDKRFVEINCAALTESLLEAELFGYEKGAFTNALAGGKIGLFEAGDGGTVFLDEVTEMGVNLQAKLLRVLQEKRFTKVGGIDTVSVDVRVIASTNRKLEEAVQEGQFREDLYYRLKVIPICLPPLRERKDDIPLLTKYFIDHFNREFGKNLTAVSPEAEKNLIDYNWPGNVRELRNVIERGAILSGREELTPDLLLLSSLRPPVPTSDDQLPLDGVRSIAEVERMLIEKVLREKMWRRTEAASALGINRTTLYKKIKEYGIEPQM